VDGRFLEKNQNTGIENYTIEVLNSLSKEKNLNLVYVSQKESISKSLNYKNYLEKNRFLKHLYSFLWFFFFSHRIVNKLKIDFYFGCQGFLPLFLNKKIKKVLTVYDLTFKLQPKTMRLKSLLIHSIFLKYNIFMADFVVTISKSVANDLMKLFSIKSIVSYPFLTSNFKSYNKKNISKKILSLVSKEKYLFTVSTIEPRKNLEFFLDIFNNLTRNNTISLSFVIAGKLGWNYNKVLNLINCNNKIIYLGYINDDEKKFLMKNCLLFTFPSLYEGFGIPIIEAQSFNKPLLLKRTPISIEASNNKAYFYDDSKSLSNLLSNYTDIKTIKRSSFAPKYKSIRAYKNIFLKDVY